jgi:hypothetical protein
MTAIVAPNWKRALSATCWKMWMGNTPTRNPPMSAGTM